MHDFEATVDYVHDGDTVVFRLDRSFDDWSKKKFRLAGINARELTQPGGPEAKANLEQLLNDQPLMLRSIKTGKYDYQCVVFFLNDVFTQSINTILVETGWAVYWDGKGSKPIPKWPRE